MSDNSNINLVFNFNRPSSQYFKQSNAGKRTVENAFVTVASKKRKLSHSTGKAIRPSSGKAIRPSSNLSKNHKLKINSFLNSQKRFKSNEALPKENSHFPNSNSKNREKGKVTFNSEVEIFSEGGESVNNNRQETSLSKVAKKKEIIAKKLSKNGKQMSHVGPGLSKSPAKSIISSLFRKNPEIPEIPIIENAEQKSVNAKIFSNSAFNSLDISPKLIDTVSKLGCSTMTTVQHLSIPAILEGKDALVKSQTGSGKTLAYALPIVHKLMMVEPKINRRQGLFALIVVPTRELAVQSYQWFEKLCKTCVWVVPGYLIGGEKKKAEKARIRKGINILIATPGRLIDHIDNTNSLELDKLQFLILDEADRMLDMGYEQNIKGIIFSLNKVGNAESRQTVMLSATLTNAVEKLAGITLKSPKTIDVTSDTVDICDGSTFNDEYLVTPENLKHHFMLVPLKVRLVSLAAFIIEKCKFSDEKKILVFMTTQDMVDYHTSLFAKVLSKIGKKKSDPLEKRALKVLSGESDDEEDEEDFDADPEDEIHFMKLHGNLSQPERTAVFKSFHEASSGVLLCTDVASRGLDLPRVNWIIQYNPASNASDYVHRVGRTARANLHGSAVVFISPSESAYVSMLEKQGISFTELRMENVLKILTHPSLYVKDIEKVPSNMEIGATRIQDKFENAVESNQEMNKLAVQGYISFVRSYAAIPKVAREYFCFKLLHLGHCAKSFALRDAPAVLGCKGAKKFKRMKKIDRGDKKPRKQNTQEKERTLISFRKEVSEFDSGIVAIGRKRKRKSL